MTEETRAGAPETAYEGSWLHAFVVLTAAVAVIALFFIFGARTFSIVSRGWVDPADNAIPESAVVLGITWAAQGEPVFRDATPITVPSMLYGPMTYYIPATVGKWLSMTQPHELRFIARLWSLMSTLLITLIVIEAAATLRRREGRRASLLWPLLAGLFSFIFIPMPNWFVTTRCDPPYLLLNILVIRLLMRHDDEDRLPVQTLVALGALILFSASIRQIVLAPPATICLWMLCRRRYLDTILFCIAVPLAGLALLFWGDAALGGHLIENTIKGGAIEYNLTRMRERYHLVLPYVVFLATPATVWAASAWRARRVGAFALYPFCAFPFAFLLSGKEGSAATYYWETLVAFSPAAVLALETEWERLRALWREGRLMHPPPSMIPISVGLCLGALLLGAEAGNYLKGLPGEPRVLREEMERDIAILKAQERPVVAFPLSWAGIMAEKDYIVIDLYLHQALAKVDAASNEAVIERLRAEPADLAIDDKVFIWPEYEPFRQVIEDNYVKDEAVSEQLETVSLWRRKAANDGG